MSLAVASWMKNPCSMLMTPASRDWYIVGDDRLRLIAGYNGLFPRGAFAGVAGPDHNLLLGVRAFLVDFAWFYLEGRVGVERDAGRETPANSIMLGLRFEFSSRRALQRWLSASNPA